MNMIGLLYHSTLETIAMVFISGLVAVLLGAPLGVLMYMTNHSLFNQHKLTYRITNIIVNILRSIPFIILLVAITPITRFIVGTSIGTVAAMVPLTISAIPFFARLVESALNEISHGLIEASQAMGAAHSQIIFCVLLRESLPAIVRAITLTLITLVGYSAMAGAIGGGGLGSLAIAYGYQRFEINIMISTVVILIVMVQILQWTGDWIAKKLTH